MPTPRISITPEATKIVDQLREQFGELMFHQSGGCCDGSAPMCYPKGDFILSSADVKLGEIHGCEFFMARDQFEYWQYTHLTVDISEGRGASFSLEIPLGLRFLIRSRVFTEDELQDLEPAQVMPD